MNRLFLAACFCVAWAVTCWAQTALRPDQISPTTPDITWAPGGTGYQFGSTVPWRTDSGTGSPTPLTFTSNDRTRVVELTAAGPIAAQLPDATGAFGPGFGFVIQVGSGTLTLSRCPTTSGCAGTTTINGQASIQVGAYQAVGLSSRGNNWYATFSLPQPATQTGTTRLLDSMAWQPVGAAASASWNPSDMDSSIGLTTVTTFNDTATKTGTANTYRSVRATAPSYDFGSAHKVVATFAIVAASDAGAGQLVGVNGTLTGTCPGAGCVSNGSHIGAGTPSWAAEGAGAGDFQNNVSSTTGCSTASRLNFITGSTVWLAIDFSSGKVWCSANCTTWYISGTPASGTGQAATLTSGTYFLAWTGHFGASVTDVVRLNASPNLIGCGASFDSSWHTWNAG
jgi:hypothetical protein